MAPDRLECASPRKRASRDSETRNAYSEAFIVLSLLVAIAPSARAVCPPLPSWALAYDDQTNCNLIVDAGGSWGQVTVVADKHDGTATLYGTSNPAHDSYLESGPTCPGAHSCAAPNPCNKVIYNYSYDGYATNQAKNADEIHGFNASADWIQHLWYRDVFMGNNWYCRWHAWSGPNGLSCAPSGDVNTCNHPDIIECFDGPDFGGWVVYQNVDILNQDSAQYGYPWCPNDEMGNACPDPIGPGGALMQNVRVGNVQQAGLATSFIDDCKVRWGDSPDCEGGLQFFVGTWATDGQPVPMPVVWLVGVTQVGAGGGAWRFEVGDRQQIDKIVVVQGGGGSNGWPGPLGPGPMEGGGTCPNGLLVGRDYHPGTPVTQVYCYDYIETALAAGHQRPPFINLSPVGWNNPPPGASSGASGGVSSGGGAPIE
jgi:hypothetical protein